MSEQRIKKKFFKPNSVDGSKIRLDNAQFIRARNAADSADVEMLKVNASNDMEAGVDLDMGTNVIKNLADPTNNQDAATKKYVDDEIGLIDLTGIINDTASSTSSTYSSSKIESDFVNAAGDTMSGALAMGSNAITGLADPTNNQDAATKKYVDDEIDLIINDSASSLSSTYSSTKIENDFVNAAGDTMSGALAMGSNAITGLADPTNNQDAATKKYVDDEIDLVINDTASSTGSTYSSSKIEDDFVNASGDTMSGALDMDGNAVTGLPAPVAASDAVNKQYVDAIAEGLHVHAPARLLADVDLGGTYNNGSSGIGAHLDFSTPIASIDSVTSFNVGDRIILSFQNGNALDPENGIYYIEDAADINIDGDIIKLTRTQDFDSPAEMAGGDFVFVQEGTQYADTGWVMTETVATVGTTPVQFLQFSGAGSFTAGNGLQLVGGEFSVLAEDSTISVGALGIKVGAGSLDHTYISDFDSEVRALLSAGDGIDYDSLTGAISVDLAAGGGLKIVGEQIEVEPNDFAGDGLVDDGTDNLAIDWAVIFTIDAADMKAVKASDLASTSAGKGASIIGVQDVDGNFANSNLESVLGELQDNIDAADTKQVKVSMNDATEGYLEEKIVGASGKISVTTLNDGLDEDLQIDIGADVFDKTVDTTDNITEGSTNLFFTEPRATGSILSGFVSAAGVVSSADSIEVAIEKLDGNIIDEAEARVDADDALSDRIDQLELASQYAKESISLVSGDISNGYVDLAFEVVDNSIVAFVGRLAIHLTEDFVTQVVGGVTRIKWDVVSVPAGSLHSAGDEALEAGDKLFFTYIKKLA